MIMNGPTGSQRLVATCLLVYLVHTVTSEESSSCGCGGSPNPDLDPETPSRINDPRKPSKVRTTYVPTGQPADYYSYYRSMYRYWRPGSKILLTKSKNGPELGCENGTSPGVFVCPLSFEPSVIPRPAVRRPSDNLVLILAGCLAGLLVIGALGGFLFWLWYCKKRFNHIAPHETAYVMHVPLPAAAPSKPLQSSFAGPAHAERRASVRVHFHPQIDNYPFQMDSTYQAQNGQQPSGREIAVVSQVGEKPSFSVSDPPPAYEEHAKHNTTTTHM
ncbi:hypothetical protein NP493_2661g00000 [Ridgeia piscesae]|uniref:Uncharacterized protein n=1 Tax=Ridgeia piscesae TaxID=27915 RepID=A0AAD9N160_RIDPI|nr:hypothetical protein NP493_2661g00000 [Ridgeia piscesae]